jgi:hypothetical protein
MKNKNLLSVGIVSVLFFAACKKLDNGPSLTPQQKALTNKIWKLKSLTVPKLSDPSQDSSILKSCSDSALMAFDIYSVYQIADPTKSCDSSIIPYSKGNWAMSSNNDTLLLFSKRNLAWKIDMVNDTILKATFRDSISPEKNAVKKITFKIM